MRNFVRLGSVVVVLLLALSLLAGCGGMGGGSTVTEKVLNTKEAEALWGEGYEEKHTVLTAADLKGYTTIGAMVFQGSNLTSVTISDGLTTIGRHAFDDCTSLTSIEIPSTVTDIWENAFENRTGLTSVTMKGTKPPKLEYSDFELLHV